MSISPELINDLQKTIAGEVRADPTTRLLYSTDASLYQIEPLGVVFPRVLDDLQAIMELAAKYDTPVLARGAGSSLAGQAIGPALIVDCSRYLNTTIEINPEENSAWVDPGVILNALNRGASAYGLQFGPDPASAERATLAGSLANNASGAHAIQYGMAADHLLAADIILSDGSQSRIETVSLAEAHRKAESGESREAALYRAALNIREKYADTIRQKWPRTWRRASGYNLNYLLPWSPGTPPLWENGAYPPMQPGMLSLAPLLVGSEGTLAIFKRAKVKLVPKPRHTLLGILAYGSLEQACADTPRLLEFRPAAIELIPENLIRLAKSVPAYARSLSFVDQLATDGRIPAALLVVEFAGDHPQELKAQAQALGEGALLAESPSAQRQVWDVRKVGLGILQSRAGNLKPVTFIEDLSVPVENLARFVVEMERILSEHGTQGDFYAHASSGCLHMRPILDIKSPQGVAEMRSIATQAVDLVLQLGGSATGEHGDGLARSEWLEKAYGKDILAAFRQLKQAADPHNLLNPGKILDAPSMDANLRYWEGYQTTEWDTALDFSGQAGLTGAIELCNGAGVCRKAEGVMCPSFQATGEEMHSTRGRANLLRALLAGGSALAGQAQQTSPEKVYEALDLCLACKGCKAECPSLVDMAKLKYEFFDHYYQTHRRRLRDYLFGYIGPLVRLGHPFARLVNGILGSRAVAILGEKSLGLARERPFPQLARRSLGQLAREGQLLPGGMDGKPQVLVLSDPFTDYFYPQNGQAGLQLLTALGVRAQILPVQGAGRTLISKGFLEPARRQANRVVEAIRRLDPNGSLPVIGFEPSEIYTLRDEFLDLLPGDPYVADLSRRAYALDEYLVRPRDGNKPRVEVIFTQPAPAGKVLLHGHCYQKAQPPAADGYPLGVQASKKLLEAAGYEVKVIDSGCCGMAGAFGYEAEHYEVSMKVGELSLLPAVRQAGEEWLVAASGVSCQAQIADGSDREALHPLRLAALRIATQAI